MKPALEKWYRVSELLILNVLITVVKEHHLLPCDIKKQCLLNKNFSTMIPKVLKWLRINFHSLQEPCYNYKWTTVSSTTVVVVMAVVAMAAWGQQRWWQRRQWWRRTIETKFNGSGGGGI
jgi:hypothetical protein